MLIQESENFCSKLKTGKLKTITNAYLRSFQYKVINNILYLNGNRFVFVLPATSSYFCDCAITQCLWEKLQLKLKDNITLLTLTPSAAIFGFFEVNCQSYLVKNYIALISKLYIYKSRKNKFLSTPCLLKEN